ncbi:hypothetical protein HD806DRAFT_488202 [Xylariaceae sp. AK1471]|nr:hypothetical protein HD806DRAFT_488202 [Xylariaceae sp. AK1471]
MATLPPTAIFNYYGPATRDTVPDFDDTAVLINSPRDLAEVELPLTDLRKGGGSSLEAIHESSSHDEIRASLDVLGFAAFKHSSVLQAPPFNARSWHSKELLTQNYFPEVNAHLRSVLGATFVHCFTYALRCQTAHEDVSAKSAVDNGPIKRVHCDFSEYGAWKLLQNVIALDAVHAFDPEGLVPEAAKGKQVPPGDMGQYGGRRWAIYSFWRPLEPVKRDPLGVCDARSVNAAADVLEMKRSYPAIGETQAAFEFGALLYRPPLSIERGATVGTDGSSRDVHRWFSISGQKPDEVLLIKLYDTERDRPYGGPYSEGTSRVAAGIPHVSFEVPGTQHEAPRQSIEVRALVVW